MKRTLPRLHLPLTIFLSAAPPFLVLIPVLAIPRRLAFLAVLVLVFHRLARRLALLAVPLLPPAALRLGLE